MAHKECPHCGNVVAPRERRCGCGYQFPRSGSAMLGSKAARDSFAQMRTGSPQKARKKKSKSKPGTGKRVRETAVSAEPGEPMSSQLIACPSCPAQISKRAERCPKCGKSPYAKCLICSNEIRANSTACTECGDPDPFNP